MNHRLIILCALTLAGAVPASADEIVLKRSVRIRNDEGRVLLGDIARLDGEHALKWADLEIGSLVSSDRPLELSVQDVRRALVAAGANRARFDLSGNVVIVRPGTTARPGGHGPEACTPLAIDQRPRKADPLPAKERIAEEPKLQEAVLDPRAVLTEDSPRGLISERMLATIDREEGPLRLRIELPDAALLNVQQGLPSLEPTGRIGESSHGFRMFMAGEYVGTAVATLETKTLVHRSRRAMKRGEVVDVDDVTALTEWMPLERTRTFAAVGPMIGTRLDTRIDSRTMLQPRHFVPVINRNDPIKVRSGGSGWSMELDCIALEEGRLGDTIEVRTDTPGINPRNARPIQVVIRDAGLAILAN